MTNEPSQQPRAMLVSASDPGSLQIQAELERAGFRLDTYSQTHEALAAIYDDAPGAIVVSSQVPGWAELVRQVKSDLILGHLPLVLVMQAPAADPADLLSLPFDDVVLHPPRPAEVVFRVRARMQRVHLALDANPLTLLPGNYSIGADLQRRLDAHLHFGLGYVDLDNFKAYNDRYSFARGDEAIKMTARIIANAVREVGGADSFVGHVGGDDFVFIVSSDQLEPTCQRIIDNFSIVGPVLADDEDRERGFFESVDRRGHTQRFPLLSMSIAGINTRVSPIAHPGEAATIAGEVKKKVKAMEGSNYSVNRRAKLK
jgi:GGDEF domain-containing protein